MNAPLDPFEREAPRRMSRRKRYTIGAVAVIGVAIVCWQGVRMGAIPLPGDGPWTKEAWDYSRAQGDRIVAAINAFRTREGRYPASLDQLVPGDMASIPLPAAGVPRWEYTISPKTGEFTLKFGKRWKGALYPCFFFTGGASEWNSDF